MVPSISGDAYKLISIVAVSLRVIDQYVILQIKIIIALKNNNDSLRQPDSNLVSNRRNMPNNKRTQPLLIKSSKSNPNKLLNQIPANSVRITNRSIGLLADEDGREDLIKKIDI